MTRYASISTAVLLGFVLWSCTDPISPIEEFDFVFEEIEDVDLGEEPDTSAVEVEYTPIEEDTAYIERQNSFLGDAQSSQETGTVSESVTETARAAGEAFDEETESELDTLAQQAEQDPDAFVEDVEQALDDPDSPTSQFVTHVENLAAQQESLAELLDLTPSSGKSFSVRQPVGPIDASVLFGTAVVLTCAEDARAQHDRKLAELDAERAAKDAAVERALERSLAAAESFRVEELERLDAERLERRRRARDFFTDVRATITALREGGVVPDSTARELRLVNITILLTRLKKSRTLYRASVEAANVAADSAIQRARDKRASELQKISTAYDEAVKKLKELLDKALRACHDQGQSSG